MNYDAARSRATEYKPITPGIFHHAAAAAAAVITGIDTLYFTMKFPTYCLKMSLILATETITFNSHHYWNFQL